MVMAKIAFIREVGGRELLLGHRHCQRDASLFDRNRHGVARRSKARNRQCVIPWPYSYRKLDVELVQTREERRWSGVSYCDRTAVNPRFHTRTDVDAVNVGRVRAETRPVGCDEIGRSVSLGWAEWRRLEGEGVLRRRWAAAVRARGENGGRG